MRRRRKSDKNFPRGLNLVELMIVMAISTMLMGGAMLWFQAQNSTDFYNNSRQLEAYTRELQSQSSSNIVPGFTDKAGCVTRDRSDCPIGQNEEVFGTAIAVQNNPEPTFTVYYLKAKDRSATPPYIPQTVEAYSQQEYKLPVSVRYTGSQLVPNGNACTATGTDYSNVARHDIGGSGTYTARGPMMIVFRRQPSAYYVFPTASFTGAATQMASYGYTTPVPTYRPCAAMWEFEGGDATTPPQFTFEMIFNVLNTTTRLQTR